MTAQPERRRGRPPRTSVDEIVDVALELFAAHGVDGTTIDAVARRVGLSDAGLLHHVGSKRGLVDAVLERGMRRQVERMRALVAPGGLQAIRNMAAWGAVLEETPQFAAFQVATSHEGIRADSPVHDWVVRRYAGLHRMVVGLVEEAVAREEVRPDVDADWEASAVVAYLDGIRLQWFYSGGTLPVARHVERYIALMVERIAA